jgi:hypothetical protein
MGYVIRSGRAAIAAAVFGAVLFGPCAFASVPLEYAVKAAYLSKFGIFVEWPNSVFDSPESPVILCIAGADPFDGTLDKVVQGQRIGNRKIVVRRMSTVSRDSGCEILYAGGSDQQSIDQALAAVSGANVLTVTDSVPDSHAPGIVEFVVQNNRVRFNIDDEAARRNGITISSHLLSLALNVRPRS